MEDESDIDVDGVVSSLISADGSLCLEIVVDTKMI